MWEGEPVGVDQKRPLVGFALVAVLCAVLMTVSVGRGWGMDIFRPGKPIAAPAEVRHRAPVHAAEARSVARQTVTIPAELSAQPLGAAVPEPISKRVARATAQSQPDGQAATQSQAPERQADRATQRAERMATREADKAAAKAEREAEQAAAAAARDAERAAAEAAREAEKAAAEAAREAEKAAAAAVRDAAKLAREVLNTAR